MGTPIGLVRIFGTAMMITALMIRACTYITRMVEKNYTDVTRTLPGFEMTSDSPISEYS
jgi:hypothetical protein